MDNIKSEILEALEQYNGIVSTSCASIGLARSTFYNWLNEDAEFKKSVDEIQEVAIDFVESKLMEKINGVQVMSGESIYSQPPSDTAIIFYLKTKGKKRGYVEKQEIEHTGSMHVTVSKEEAQQIAKDLEDKF